VFVGESGFGAGCGFGVRVGSGPRAVVAVPGCGSYAV